jgi:hypothetical protein
MRDLDRLPPIAARPPFPFARVADLKFRAPQFVIDGLLETESLGLLFGDPGCGKSFLAVDLAASVATGTPFHGRATRQGSVFVIAGEGHSGLARRFAAWTKARNTSLVGAPLFKSERAASFLDAASAAAVAQSVEALAREHGAPALIVVDTLARNFGSGDENSTSDMNQFVAAIDDLKANFAPCSVLIVHHAGHGDKGRARGAMALKGAVDHEFRLEKTGDLIAVSCTKMKDAEPPPDAFFKLASIALDGCTSAVLEAAEAPQRERKLTHAQQTAMAAYRTAARDHGRFDGGAFRGVCIDDWRSAFYAIHTGDSLDAKRKAFQRARRDLVEAGQMRVTDDIYLTLDAAAQASALDDRDTRDTAGHFAICPAASVENGGTSGTHPLRGVPCPVSTGK